MSPHKGEFNVKTSLVSCEVNAAADISFISHGVA